MIKRLAIVVGILLILAPYGRAFGQDRDLESFLQNAYEQKKKSAKIAMLLSLVPSAGHAYIGFDRWSNRGVFFLLGETACLTVAETLGYATQRRSIGPGIYEEWENQPTFFLYAGIMAFTAFKIYEIWDVNDQVQQYNREIRQRYDLTLGRSGDRTQAGLVVHF